MIKFCSVNFFAAEISLHNFPHPRAQTVPEVEMMQAINLVSPLDVFGKYNREDYCAEARISRHRSGTMRR